MVNSGLRKLKKKDPIQASAILHMPELHGAVFNFGRIRSGKTVALMTYAQAYHDHPNRRYKVIDIWGGDRNEHLYWCLPSNKINYWNKAKKTLRLSANGPKQYKVNLLYPVIGKIPKKLPHNDYVHSKLFTIAFDDLLTEDLALISGSLSSRDEALWNDIRYECTKKTIPEMMWKIEKSKGQTFTIFKNAIRPLVRSQLLQKHDCPLNLDIVEELNDQKTITVLCLDFVDVEYKLFIAGYMCRKIFEALSKRRRQVVLPFREASEIFRVTDQSIVPERVKIFKSYLSQWIRMGRVGMHFLLDTQSPAETRGLVSGQQDLTLLGRLPSQADRNAATEQLYNDNLITKKQITLIGSLEPGQFIVCPSGKHAYFQYFLLPKSRFWEEGDGSFYNNIWKNSKYGDKWTELRSEIEQLKNQRKIEEAEVKEKKKKIKEEAEEQQEQSKQDLKEKRNIKKRTLTRDIRRKEAKIPNEVKIKSAEEDYSKYV